jgi:hypothetical protein
MTFLLTGILLTMSVCASLSKDAFMSENDMKCWLQDTDKGRLCTQRKPHPSVMPSTTNPRLPWDQTQASAVINQ